MSAQLLRELRLVGAARDRGDLEAHPPRVLHPEMPEATDAEHGDQIAGLRRRVSQSAKRREPGAQERGCVHRRKAVRDRDQPARFREHDFSVAAVALNAGVCLVAAVDEVAVAAKFAVATKAAEEANANALTGGPAANSGPERVDPSDDLMAR